MEAADPELAFLIVREEVRQYGVANLVISENTLNSAAKECLGSSLNNKQVEGQPGERISGGTDFIDQIESLCEQRVHETFGLQAANWTVSAQFLFCIDALRAAFKAVCVPGDKILGLNLLNGGQFSNGFIPVPGHHAESLVPSYESHTYFVDPETGLLNYDAIEAKALEVMPKVIVCGAVVHVRAINFARFKEIADLCGAKLIADISGIAGLVATNLHPSPFPYADIVVLSTNETLRGPRGALVIYKPVYETAIRSVIATEVQGGPHVHTIAAIAASLKEIIASPSYTQYILNTLINAKHIADMFTAADIRVVTGGTDNHVVMINLASRNIDVVHLLNLLETKHSILASKARGVPGLDIPQLRGLIGFGTACMTSRWWGKNDFTGCVNTIIEEIVKHTDCTVSPEGICSGCDQQV